MVKNRYFMAVVLRGQPLADAEAIKDELLSQFRLRGALRSPAHITLHRPFEWRADKEKELIAKLGEFTFVCPFQLRLSRFASFSNRVIYIDVAPDERLKDLRDSLAGFARKRLLLMNEAEDERGFHPHVTVAFRDLRRNRFAEVWEWVQTKSYSHSVTVEGFSLLRLEDRWREIRFFDLCSGSI